MNPFAGNPHSLAIRRYLFEVLKERYKKNESYIERIASSVAIKEDYEALGALVADVYESGFMKAVEQYKDQIAKMGYRVQVVPESKPVGGKSIFGDD